MAGDSFGLRVRFSGGDADKQMLDAYDGSTSLHGFAQALQIATNAYINQDVTNYATALKNAKVFMRPARQGSFITDFTTVITRKPKGVTVNAQTFYDFITFAFNQAVGRTPAAPKTAYVDGLIGPEKPFFDDLTENLEGSLQRAHRVISEGGVTEVSVQRPRGEQLVEFDLETSLWVNTMSTSAFPQSFTGNITRFNSVSPNGRAFIDEFGRIVPFKRGGDFPEDKRGLLSWSLHGSNLDTKKKLELVAREVKSSNGVVKRLVVSDCARIEE
ncbi:DUF7946 domain-containing protein [Aurantimonas coralicida]|uniref:DUF7946 domain-containing protein n=1 Tax=Aurantimonas coralicida TaxID=182270 RepID=A0A0P0YZF4_9HYPH|nr:hypothetical protein [Aurantimonas coralicida]BAT26880.1 hypothetical protein [Aurantimonas coralicida]